jgi:hypothetical protein
MFPRNIKEKKISGDTQIPFKPINQSKNFVRKVRSSVGDSESLNPDPDPAFQVNPDQDSIRIQGFDDQK